MTTIADCWAAYTMDHLSKTCDPGANTRYWGRLKWFGPKNAEHLSSKEVEEYIGFRAISPAGINRELTMLRAALRYAEREGLIDRASHIPKVPGSTPKLRALSVAEAQKIVAAADKGNWREQVYVRLALGTGARPGAICDLRWSQIHKTHGSIDYRVQDLPTSHRMKRRAIVPINNMVKEALRIASKHISANGNHVLHVDGKKLSSPKPLMARIAKRAGIKNCSPHVLRHTVASILLSGGEDLLKVSRLLGHANTKITEEVYFQHPPAWLKKTTDLLDF